jgi:DHA2 family multidrug resistance protein
VSEATPAPTPAAPPARGGLRGLNRRDRAILASALAFGTFMQVLDTSIANVSIPAIAGDLGVSADQGTWVITSFAVANGISVPLTGWLMQRFGLVRTFVISVSLFTIASFLCGIAWSLPTLVVFRVLQGGVSGPMIPGSQALLLAVFPPEGRGLALAIWSMTALVAPIVGPIVGGYISDNYSWPWIFYINIPCGIFSALVCWRYAGKRDSATQKLPVDVVGLALLVAWVGALQIMLDKGKHLDWFASPQIVVLAIVTVIGFVAFLIWELTARYPIVDLTLFRSRNFAIGNIVLCVGYAVFFGNLVLFPLWLQTQLNYTATWAGLVAAPSGVVAVLLSPIVGRVLSRVDARWIASIAMLTFGASYFMRAGLNTQADYASIVAPLLVQGLGMATFFIGMVALTLHGLPPERIPSASGVSNFARITAGSFAASIVTTFWDRREAFHQTRLAEASSAYSVPLRDALARLHALGLSDGQAVVALSHSLVGEAYAKSSIDLFSMSGWLVMLLIIPIWLTRSTLGGGAKRPSADAASIAH